MTPSDMPLSRRTASTWSVIFISSFFLAELSLIVELKTFINPPFPSRGGFKAGKRMRLHNKTSKEVPAKHRRYRNARYVRKWCFFRIYLNWECPIVLNVVLNVVLSHDRCFFAPLFRSLTAASHGSGPF